MSGLIERAIEKVLLGESPTSDDLGCKSKIVVCQRGFIYAGNVTKNGDYIVINDAVNIRRWGTSRGLGELAAKGNQPETKADACGTVRVHQLAVVAMIDCDGVSIHASTE
jgi:hypothetical protein